MKNIDTYLEDFKKVADKWFTDAVFLEQNYMFFKNFFKKENLEKAESRERQVEQRPGSCHSGISNRLI